MYEKSINYQLSTINYPLIQAHFKFFQTNHQKEQSHHQQNRSLKPYRAKIQTFEHHVFDDDDIPFCRNNIGENLHGFG